MSKDQWQETANQNQNEKRKGTPFFSGVRLESEKEKKWLDAVVKKFPGTKREALIAAMKLLEKELKK